MVHMAQSTSKTAPLFLSVSPGDPRSITRQITDGIRMAIASGKLPVGAQLPSVRGLAQQLVSNPDFSGRVLYLPPAVRHRLLGPVDHERCAAHSQACRGPDGDDALRGVLVPCVRPYKT